MADKTIPDLPEISVVDATDSFLVIDNGTQTYKIKPVNIPGLPKTPSTELTITADEGITPTSWLALGFAYADKNNVWKLNFDISLLINSTTDNNWTLAIEGVEFYADMYQHVGVSTGGANINEFNATTVPGTNQIRVRISNSVPGDYVRVSLSGDVYIEAKPDWADDISSPGDGFIPGEGGGAVNSVNGFTGDVTLTTSDIPEGSRPYFTDPRARAAAVQDVITPGVADRAPSQKAVATALDARQATSQKNQANGYPGLDSGGKIPLSTIPGSILGALIYQGAWSALGGTYPPSPTKGYYWIINVAGTISGVTYNVKDWIVYNGSGWDKVSGSESPSVLSVNAKTGTVVLDTDDLAEGAGNKFFTDARARGAAVQDAIADGVSNIAPSQNAVYDALALAASTTTTLLADKEDKSAKGAANGYAPLGTDSKVPIANLPSIAGGIPTDIGNGDFENTADGATPVGWVGYTDAAAATPVDGTGGTVDPTLTLSVSTTAPLRGTRSAILSKPASNMQGKGWSYDFTMPKADIGNKHRIRVDIEASTNYVQDDLRFYIYDVTNSTLITPSTASVPKFSGKTWEVSWMASSSASYRLIMHVASTSALAWTMKVDTWIVNCEPSGQAYGDKSAPVAGEIIPFAGSTVPDGYLLCNGQEVSQTTYPDLYARIGSTNNTQTNPTTGLSWAAPSAGNFRVPDLRGSFIRGVGSPNAGSVVTLGGFQNDQMQGHRHAIPYYNNAGGSAQYLQDFNKTVSKSAVQSDTGSTLDPTTDGGNGTPRTGTETRPKNYGANFIIRCWDATQNMNVGAGANVEYASSAQAWDATGTTTQYGPGGSAITGALTATRTKLITFQNPIQTDDIITLEYRVAGTQSWIDSSISVYPPTLTLNSNFGGFVNNISATTVTIAFSQFAQAGTTYNTTTGASNYSAATYDAWRVRKCKASSPVGFGLATTTDSGLVSKEYSGTHNTTWSGPFAATAGNILYDRVGKKVTLNFNEVRVNGNNTTANIVATTVLPVDLRPAIAQNVPVFVQSAGTAQTVIGYMLIATNGNVTVFKDIATAGGFPTTASMVGFYAITTTYTAAT